MPTLDAGLVTVTTRAFESSCSVERISCWREMERFFEDWERLAKTFSPPSYFVSWAWAKTWWCSYGNAYELFVLLCRNQQQEVIGIAPLYRATGKSGTGSQGRSLRLIGDGTDDVDGFGLLIGRGREQACARAFLDWLAAHPEEWDLLDLNSMPEDSLAARGFLAQVRERGWVARSHWTPHSVVELPQTWDAYLQVLSRKVRQTWLRRIRHAEKEFELRLRRCETPSEIDAGLDIVMDLHQRSWRSRGSNGKFDLASRRDFYRDICRIAGEQKDLDLWLLELDGVPRAARLGFLSHKTRHGVIAAMDPGFARYGVGTIAEALVLKASIERGVGSYDFLAGDEPYKKECGATTKRYANFKAARPRTRAGIALGAEGSVEDGKRWLRTNMPDAYGLLQKAKRNSLRVILPSTPASTTVLQRLDRAGIQLHVVRDYAGFMALRREWSDLLRQSQASSIFQSWEWMDPWLQAYGDKELMIIAGHVGQDLIGLLPLYVSAWPKPGRHSLRRLRLMADDPDDAGGLGLIARPDHELGFADVTVDWLMKHRDDWEALELDMLAENTANSALLAALAQRNFVMSERWMPHMVLSLPGPDHGLESADKEARRIAKRLGSRTIEFRRCGSKGESENMLEALFRLHTARWQSKGKPGAFARAGRKDFYRKLSASMLDAGLLDIWSMGVDSTIAAIEFGLVRGHTRYSLQAGFDPALGEFKVGRLLDLKIIESARANGIHTYDLLFGDAAFKREMGAERETYRFVRCAPAHSRAALWVRASAVRSLQRAWATIRDKRFRSKG